MDLFKRKIGLFCVSNVMVSFICTSFLGINYHTNLEILSENQEKIELASNDTEPASRLGENVIKAINWDLLKKQTMSTPKVTRLSTNEKTVTNIVTKKEVANKVTYTPAKYSAVTGNAIVDYAKKYLGLRYVSGGNSLSTGTDCSGFTKLIYKEFGITLSRSAQGQTSSGSYVRKDDLQKGDLVFYGTGNGRISHVGIYIGNGQVLHESNRRDGVKISSVNMMQYITARRVINSASIKIVEEKLAKEEEEKKLVEEEKAPIEEKENVNTNSEKIEQTIIDTNNTDLVIDESNKTVQESVEKENVVSSENQVTPKETTDTDITVVETKEVEEKIETETSQVNTQVELKEESKSNVKEEVKEEIKEDVNPSSNPSLDNITKEEVISSEENQE